MAVILSGTTVRLYKMSKTLFKLVCMAKPAVTTVTPLSVSVFPAKRLQLLQVSPPKKTPPQVRKRERGGLV